MRAVLNCLLSPVGRRSRWSLVPPYGIGAALLLAQAVFAAPELPGRAPAHPVALVGGTVHTVSGEPIAGGVVLFDNGKILRVGGADTEIPQNAERIDVAGKRVYPGLIEPGSELGLIEIESVRATRDLVETGEINPNIKAHVGFNPDSELIPVARSGGVLLNVTTPRGGLISGTGSLMQLDGWTWEEMLVKAPTGMYVNWPRYTVFRDQLFGSADPPDAGARSEMIRKIRQALTDARTYQAARAAPGGDQLPVTAIHEALWPLLAGQMPLVVRADDAQAIQSAVAFAAQEKLKLVVHGGYDAPKCAELLKRHDVAVVVAGTHRLPQTPSDAYDEPFAVPARLHAAGIRFCISSSSEAAWNIRNLHHQAATAAAFGLPPEVAVKAITLYPAQILGVADRVGSLEPGKDATLIVTDGDVLEMTTRVEQAFITGRPVDLSNRHTRLYEKYREKYRRKKAG